MTLPAAPPTDAIDDAANAARAQPAALARPIVLVGMMGAGKSTVGRRLAQRLHCPFADADDEIERAAGMSVAEIFEKFGEQYFRDGERRVIARLLKSAPIVLAAGGGAFADDATRALILDQGYAIWLDVPVEVLVERVRRRNHRPLLHGRDARAVLDELLERRGPAYAQAPLRVASGVAPHERAVEAIVAALTLAASVEIALVPAAVALMPADVALTPAAVALAGTPRA